MTSLLQPLEWCGRQGRWVLPVGLLCGVFLPWAAEPSRYLITPCIWLLLFLSYLRLSSSGVLQTPHSMALRFASIKGWLIVVLCAQFALPVMVFFLATALDLPDHWRMAATLVAAASPISGSPSLVLLLKGDGESALRWLIIGTAVLPLSCLPVFLLVFEQHSVALLMVPALKLLLIITSATLAGVVVSKFSREKKHTLSLSALDGAAALTLAIMVIGLMSALHSPDTTARDLMQMLVLAIVINAGFQLLGTLVSTLLKTNAQRTITAGVVMGNRNVALFLSVLPASSTDALLLFIACYQIPMYLTPLLGSVFYRQLE